MDNIYSLHLRNPETIFNLIVLPIVAIFNYTNKKIKLPQNLLRISYKWLSVMDKVDSKSII